MRTVPDYQELERKVSALEKKIQRLRKTALALHTSEELFIKFADVSNDIVHLYDREGSLVYANPATQRLLGYQQEAILDAPAESLVHPDDRPRFWADWELLTQEAKQVPTREIRVRRHDGTYINVLVNGIVMDFGDRQNYIGCIFRNTTIFKKSAHALLQTNHKLQQEIEERKIIEKQLLKSRRDLRRKAAYLEETNTALNVLLKKRENDKLALEEQVAANIKDLVLPVLEKLNRSRLGAGQRALVDIALLNLQEVTSEFSLKMTSRHFSLSPAEINVANFILHGKSTKEIADFLNIGVQTAKNHRLRIREKVGIKNKKVNIRAYLAALSL